MIVVAAAIAASIVAMSIFGAIAIVQVVLGDAVHATVETGAAATLSLAIMQMFIVTFVLFIAFGNGSPSYILAWRVPNLSGADASKIFFATLAFLAASYAVSVILFRETFISDLQAFVPLLTSEQWPLAMLAVVIGAPLSEELLFRGLLLGGLVRRGVSFSLAAFATTAMWTSLHLGYSYVGLMEVFLAGLMLSWTLYVTGSVIVPIVVHAVYNAVALFVMRAFMPELSGDAGQMAGPITTMIAWFVA